MSNPGVCIDGHTHVVSPDRDRYPTAGSVPERRAGSVPERRAGSVPERRAGSVPERQTGLWWEHPTSDATLIDALDRHGVDKAVVVQAVGPYAFDNRYALDVAAEHPDRLACVPAVDLDASDALDVIATLSTRPEVAGIRAFAVSGPGLDHEPGEWVRAGSFGDVLAASRTVVLTAFGHQIQQLVPALAAHPETPVAVDHGGFPDWSAAEHPFLDALAELPHVSVKLSAHLLRGAPDPHTAVAYFLERFGPGRVIGGTDYPQTSADYGALWAELVAVAPSGEDARGFLGENARRLWFATKENAR